jgi:hypothetical protein
LLVTSGLGGAAVARLEQSQIPAGLAAADADAVAEGFGRLPTGPSPLLAEPFSELAGYRCPAVVARFGSGLGGVKGSDAPVAGALERGADGVRVVARVSCDPGRRPSGVAEKYHLQARAGNGRKLGLPQTPEFRSLIVSEEDANHATLYASTPMCLAEAAKAAAKLGEIDERLAALVAERARALRPGPAQGAQTRQRRGRLSGLAFNRLRRHGSRLRPAAEHRRPTYPEAGMALVDRQMTPLTRRPYWPLHLAPAQIPPHLSRRSSRHTSATKKVHESPSVTSATRVRLFRYSTPPGASIFVIISPLGPGAV